MGDLKGTTPLHPSQLFSPEYTSPVYAPGFCQENIYKTYPPILPKCDLWKVQLPNILSVGLGKPTPQWDAYAIGKYLMGVELVEIKSLNGLQLMRRLFLTIPGFWVGLTLDATSP